MSLFFSIPMIAQDFCSKVECKYLNNFYRLNDSLYRSEQPGRKGFGELDKLGVKTVLNFRRLWKDDRKARDTGMDLVWMPLRAGKLTEAQILEALKAIKGAEKPVLIHCWHGSDRTGAISAAYRIVFEGWSKERAIEELCMEALGYHEDRYPNVIELIEDLDVKTFRETLDIDFVDLLDYSEGK
ncbi:phosphatase domain-containing putative toxin [Sinomicrobium soli]|uniref:phosphatase domain-containing putative toxin n=1 Tax=Sinomicrobium sp. N-1-3-6 TaxID=2219864 RepID=UPI0013750E8E|nr:sulfur transferase domain-containing protein [Sinomicrobium sp. N-1-3-6]